MFDESFVEVDEAAQQMGISEDQVLALAARGVLRSNEWGAVQPALVVGWM